jgi:23S rRNA (cytosine1962-C5)-methyltransferase
VHWITEGVLTFCQRELRRGHQYRALVLDPPSFGRGPAGEVWKIEKDLGPLLDPCRQPLEPAGPACLLLSCQSPGFSPLALHNLVGNLFPGSGVCEASEMTIPEGDGNRTLPSGCCGRWARLQPQRASRCGGTCELTWGTAWSAAPGHARALLRAGVIGVAGC